MKKKKFKKLKHRKEMRHYIDPNDLKEKDNKTSYLKEIAGLATILGAGVTGGAMMADDRVYAAESSVDRKSEIIGSNSITGSIDEEVSNNNQKTASATDSNSVKLSQSQSTEQSVTYSKSRSLLASMSLSTSTSFSQSASASAAVSLSESASASTSAAKSTSDSKSKSTSKASTKESTSQKSESKSTAENTKTSSESESVLAASSVSKNNEGSASDNNSQVVGSVSDSIQLNPSGKTNSKSTEKENSISNSEAQSSSTSKSLSISESVSDSISQSESISDIVSQSQSFSHSLSQSESVLSSLSLAKNKSTEKRSNTQKIHRSHLSSNEHNTVLQSNKNVEENSTGINRSANTSHVSKSTITSAYSSSSNNIPTASQASLDLNKNISSLVNLPLATNNTIERNNSTANSQLPIALGANFVTLATTNDTVVKPTFSGTVMIKNADGSNVNGTDFKDGAVPTYTFRLSTYGDSNVTNPQFIIMIPKGFTATTADFSTLTNTQGTDIFSGGGFAGPYNGKSTIKALGNYGPNGEQLFMITLTGATPTWGNNFGGQVKLTLDANAKGVVSYNVYGVPFVSEVSNYAVANGTSAYGGGSYTFNVNGQAIEVVKNSTGINNQQGSINYILNKTVELPQFTGVASFGNLNSSGIFVSGNSINYTSNTPQSQIPALSVRLSTVGDSTVNNPQFVVMIPKGFTSSVTDFNLINKDVGNYFGGVFNGSNQYSTSNYSIEDLGKVGPNGEQLFKIQLDFNPGWNAARNFGGQFKLTLDPTQTGTYSYGNNGVPIVSELASDATPTAGTYTFVANGQNIAVVKSGFSSHINYAINTNLIPTFTGTAILDANGKTYSGDSVPTYSFRLSTTGESTVQNPKFIVMIPDGFTATTDDFSFNTSGYSGTASVKELGNYGPNGEQLFEVSLTGTTPNFTTNSVMGSVKLSPNFNGQTGGSHTYSNATAPLVAEVSNYSNTTYGTYTFNTSDGAVTVVKSPQTVNWTDPSNQAANSSGSVTYTIQVGKEQLPTTAYTISNIKVTPVAGETSSDAGYEQLAFSITPKQTLQDGQYIDVHLGLPDSNGNIENYDSKLAANLPLMTPNGVQIATAYNMGTYYRIVFNSEAAAYTSGNNKLTLNPILRWGNPQSQQPSISINQGSDNTTNLGKVYVYQYTDDESKNGTLFAYTPTNDVTINGQHYASGLHIQGQYVYDKQYLDCNNTTTAGIFYNNNRVWGPNNSVSINTNWANAIGFKIATSGAATSEANTGSNFDIAITVGNSKEFTYTWLTDSQMEDRIKSIYAWYVNNELSNEVAGSSPTNVYLKNEINKVSQMTSPVTVTHEETTTANGEIEMVYHVKIADSSIRLKGLIIPLTVSANGFTMPDDIKSYQEDLDKSPTVDKNNYENTPNMGAATSNTALQAALQNTAHPVMTITNNVTGDTVSLPNTIDWNTWKAGIAYGVNGDVTNSSDSTNTRTATLEFINDTNPSNPITLTQATNNFQGPAEGTIIFSDATATLEGLESEGYILEKVVDNQTGQVLTPPDGVSISDLSKYVYGSLGDGPNKFTVYLRKIDTASISASQSESIVISHSESMSNSLSNAVSMSESLSNSVSMSESLSNSVSMSESLSNSVSMSESLSNSVSMSESLSNSVSMSESLSNSVSMSESLSNSVSMSESLSNSVSMSESLSNSVSMSESLSNSVSMSESLSNSVSMSESLSNSVSMSESLSNSVSMSESLSNSVSMSESMSNSVSMSESLSNSVSMSESMSNSVSMSESLSNSVSMSESLSNSVSMSESMSNSVSMSESLSNSVSMSESLSNSVSMSESLSNSVSMSESMSNSVSMSESLSNSVSMSESLSNSVSMSESMSNSVSMSESLSNSVSMSESLSNSVSMSESLSNSVSMSESLSNSVSMSESMSNSVSMSESMSNSVSMSESLSNSVSMSESLSNSVSMSESMNNSVSMSESLSNSVSMSERVSESTSFSTSITSKSMRSTNTSESLSTSNVSASQSLIPSEIPANSLRSETGQANSVTPIASEKRLSSNRRNSESIGIIKVNKTNRMAKRPRNQKLPQTGTKNNSSLLGIIAASLGALLGLRSRKNNKK